MKKDITIFLLSKQAERSRLRFQIIPKSDKLKVRINENHHPILQKEEHVGSYYLVIELESYDHIHIKPHIT